MAQFMQPGWDDFIRQALAQQQQTPVPPQVQPAPQMMPEAPVAMAPPQAVAPAPMEIPAPAPQAAAPAQPALPEEAQPGLLSKIITGGLATLFLQNPARAIDALKQQKLATYEKEQTARHAPELAAAKATSATAEAKTDTAKAKNIGELMDQNSVVSQLARKEWGQLASNPIPENATAQDIITVMPAVGQLLEKKYGLQLRKEQFADKEEQRRRDAGLRTERDDKKFMQNMATTVMTDSRANSELKKAVARVNLANDGLRVMSQVMPGPGQKFKFDKSVAAEVFRNLDFLLTGGTSSSAEFVREMMRESGSGFTDMAQFKSYATGHPQQVFTPQRMQQLHEQLLGQRDYWKEVRDNTIGGHESLLSDIFQNPTYGQKLKKQWVDMLDKTYHGYKSAFGEDQSQPVNMGATAPAAAPSTTAGPTGTVKTSTGFTLKLGQ